jgi:undecaprenyl diphosphate synthase
MPERARDEASGFTGGQLPRHVAFIMDGNGRWARSRGLRRLRGHEEGASSLRRITRRCRALGIGEVTFFALSTENFTRRPRREIAFLMGLLKRYLIEERGELIENGIRLQSIGHVDALPEEVRAELEETERLTARLDRMVLRLALNYGSRQEILDAVHAVVRAVASGQLSLEEALALGEPDFRSYLYDGAMSDPDIVVRTGGECRLSNFLLWQSSYAEIWVTPVLWPDFDVSLLDDALRAYASRTRKYGAVGPKDGDHAAVEAGSRTRAGVSQ